MKNLKANLSVNQKAGTYNMSITFNKETCGYCNKDMLNKLYLCVTETDEQIIISTIDYEIQTSTLEDLFHRLSNLNKLIEEFVIVRQ